MSTRRASDGEFHQERFCSSPELEGDAINALLAAKRIALIDDRESREILWFIQWRSLTAGGVKQLADEILSAFPERVGTVSLQKFFKSKRNEPTAAELSAMAREGEYVSPAAIAAMLTPDEEFWAERKTSAVWEEVEVSPREQADNYLGDARSAAGTKLAQHLRNCCLDPSSHITRSPWYFIDLCSAIKEMRSNCIATAKARLADTLVSRQINNALDFWSARRRMVLIEGVAGIGRTETLRAWCDAQAGLVRYVEVPSSADDRSFYVSIARELGVARGMSFSGQQIKLRVEETLRASGLMLALDESQYLWGNALRPRKTPDRILWIKTTFDAGTPIALVAHTDFTKWQEHFVQRTLWTDEQFERRINRRLLVPAAHSVEDLLKIAQAHLPTGDQRCWKLLAAYALAAPKKRASGIVEALESARYRAQRQGRLEASFRDIEAALREEHAFLQPVVAAAEQQPCKRTAESFQRPRAQRSASAPVNRLPKSKTRFADGINSPVLAGSAD